MKTTLAALDYETTLFKHGRIPRTKLVGFYDGKIYRNFCNTLAYDRFLSRTHRRFRILHHGGFDVLQAMQDGARIRILRAHKQRIIKSVWRGHTLQNTVAMLPMTLAEIMQAFGLKKVSLTHLRERNESDCISLYQCVNALDSYCKQACGVSLLDCGTLAATGMKAAERVAGKMPISHEWPQAKRGGHTEIFATGVFDIDEYDINSSYPYSILDAPAKSKLLHVWVKSLDPYGPLFDARVTERLLFPQGKFESYVYEDVLHRYILPHATCLRLQIVRELPVDLSWLVALKPFVEKLYNLKRNADNAAVKLMAKLILNAFYGRIGLRGDREIPIYAKRVASGDDLTYYSLANGGFISFKTVKGSMQFNSPLAAYITDNARGRWYAAAVQNNALYGDTDSIFVRHGQQFIGSIGSACGEWKLEASRTVKLIGNKNYQILDSLGRVHHSVLKGGRKHYQWTLKSSLALGKVVEVVRKQGRVIHKRTFDDNGQSVPLKVGL